MKNTLLMMPITRSGTIVRTSSVATKNTAPVKASMLASVMWVSPTSTRRLTTASNVMLLGSRPSCSSISSIRRLRVTAARMRSRIVLGSKLLGLFIIGLTSIRGRRPDGGKLAFDPSIGQDWSDMKPSQPDSSEADFRRLRRKTRCGIVQDIPGRLLRRRLHGQWHFHPTIARVVRCPRHRKIIANDGFGNQAIGTRGETVAKAKFDIENAQLEIRYPE